MIDITKIESGDTVVFADNDSTTPRFIGQACVVTCVNINEGCVSLDVEDPEDGTHFIAHVYNMNRLDLPHVFQADDSLNELFDDFGMEV